MKRMRLGWVSLYNPEQKRGGWQGANHHLFKALANQNLNLEIIAPIRPKPDHLAKWKSRILTAFTGKRLVWNCSDKQLRRVQNEFTYLSKKKEIDFFIFFGSSEFFTIFPEKPWFCFMDSAFVPFLELYAQNRNYLKSEFQRLSALEKTWLDKTRTIFVSSKFAKDVIVERYKLERNKLDCVGIGPNISGEIYPESIPTKKPTLLFIGSNFIRKGGDKAVRAVQLAKKKIPELAINIVGQIPPKDYQCDGVISHGWIDRDSPEGRRKWDQLMKESSVLLSVPKHDFTPNAICEAFAYGLPVISYALGGIPEMIVHGQTGWLIPSEAKPENIAEQIINVFSHRKILGASGANARKSYEKIWNWDTVAEKIVRKIKDT